MLHTERGTACRHTCMGGQAPWLTQWMHARTQALPMSVVPSNTDDVRHQEHDIDAVRLPNMNEPPPGASGSSPRAHDGPTD